VRRIALVLLLACDKTEDEPVASAEAPAEAAERDASVEQAGKPEAVAVQIAAREPPEVTVLEPGRNPRQDLVLRPAAGTTEPIEIVTKTLMSMQGSAGRIPPTGVPPIVLDGKAYIDASDGKEIAFRHEVDAVEVRDDPTAPPGLVKTLREQASAFEAYRAELRVDAKGGLRGGTVYMPPASGPLQQTMTQITESFGQIQVPLPREPVGVGAKWRAEVVIDQAGLKLQQTVDYELLEREGDTLSIAATLQQKLVDANFTPPGMLGVDAKVVRFESRGTGSMNLDLSHLVPTRSEIEMTIDMRLETEEKGQSQAQDMAMVVAVAFARS
jgi:hypothetical protein